MPPPPPPPIIYSYTIEETLKKAHSLTRSFLAKTRKLALFSALWDKKTAPPRARIEKDTLLCGFFQRALNRKKHAEHVFIHSIRRFSPARPQVPEWTKSETLAKGQTRQRCRYQDSQRHLCPKGGLFRPLSILLLLLAVGLGFTHCSSSNGGGGNGGGDPVYTCANGTPIEGSPESDSDVESCASCNDGYGLVDGVICREPFFLHSNGITIRCPNATDGDSGMVGGIEYTKRAAADITPANAATSCTSGITSMHQMFSGETSFNGDISNWDVSSVVNMQEMFVAAQAFDQDISNWDVSNVENMPNMFNAALAFDQDISNWDVSNVENMHNMFKPHCLQSEYQ